MLMSTTTDHKGPKERLRNWHCFQTETTTKIRTTAIIQVNLGEPAPETYNSYSGGSITVTVSVAPISSNHFPLLKIFWKFRRLKILVWLLCLLISVKITNSFCDPYIQFNLGEPAAEMYYSYSALSITSNPLIILLHLLRSVASLFVLSSQHHVQSSNHSPALTTIRSIT